MLAAVTGAHGVSGEIKVKLFTDDLARFADVDIGGSPYRLTGVRPGGKTAVVRVAGVSTRDAAEALRGLTLTVDRAALPSLEPGEYYHADLIGLPAITDGGEPLGHVVGVDNFGAGDVIEIERPTGKRFMVPMTPDAVPEWSAGRLVVTAPFAAD